MRCAICNGKLIKRKCSFPFRSALIGTVSVPDVEYEECPRCDEKLFTSKMSKKITSYVRIKENKAIDNLPIGDFISSNEAADILGVSKQAFSKNPKIKKGMIISKQLGPYKYYLRDSVKLFKKKGNGKFLLPGYEKHDQMFLQRKQAVEKHVKSLWTNYFGSKKTYETEIEKSQSEITKPILIEESSSQFQPKYEHIDLSDDDTFIH